jgi:hypothetical protein
VIIAYKNEGIMVVSKVISSSKIREREKCGW